MVQSGLGLGWFKLVLDKPICITYPGEVIYPFDVPVQSLTTQWGPLVLMYSLSYGLLEVSIARVGPFWLLYFSLESSSNTFLVAIGHFGVILLCHFTLLYLAV